MKKIINIVSYYNYNFGGSISPYLCGNFKFFISVKVVYCKKVFWKIAKVASNLGQEINSRIRQKQKIQNRLFCM